MSTRGEPGWGTWQRGSRSAGESLPPTMLLEATSRSQTSVILAVLKEEKGDISITWTRPGGEGEEERRRNREEREQERRRGGNEEEEQGGEEERDGEEERRRNNKYNN